MFFGVSSSVTECFQSVTDYLQPVTELGTPKNMAVGLPGMTLQPLYIIVLGILFQPLVTTLANTAFFDGCSGVDSGGADIDFMIVALIYF